MIFEETRLPGAFVIDLERREDERGFFARTFCANEFADHGLNARLVQANTSWNPRQGTLRGMHFQHAPHAEVKVVRATRGAIHDVIVDVRRGSPTFGQWEGFDLTDENMHMLYVPVGFAHGFCVVSDTADVLYKQDAYYAGPTDRGFKYDDPDVAIAWPLPTGELIPSQRDLDAPLLRDVADGLPFEYR